MKKKKKSDHYIDNKLFFEHIKEWKILVDAADAVDGEHPPITSYIGECFIKIAENLSRKPNFINYPYRDEMISDGIENCVLYAYNFDPSKSTNPFSYFTQIIYYAFLRRIQKEKKQAYIKVKMIEKSDVDSATRRWYRETYLRVGDNFETLPTFLTENDIKTFDVKTGEIEDTEPKDKSAKTPVTKKAKKPVMEKKVSVKKGKKK